MRKRRLATLLALAAVVALAAILPRTPVGRGWLLGRVRGALSGAGVHLSYQRSTGNPWAGLELRGARLTASGLDLRVADLRLRYFLPSLITGDLPLTVSMTGVRGSVDVRRLMPLAGGRGAGLPIRPVLQELEVSDAAISIQQVPYTLPSGAVSDVRIRQHGRSLDLQAHVRTADGGADVTGVLDLDGPRFDGQVQKADVSLARHWFAGVGTGTVAGPLHIGPDGIRGDFHLQNGSLRAIGLTPSGIHGDVQLRYPLVTAELQGYALGGPVTAHGTVNIAARHWQAQAQGTPGLQDAAAWIFRDSLPGRKLPLAGKASATVDVSGWTAARVNGSVDGEGSFQGLPLRGLQADFSYDSRRGVTVQGTGRVAGGSAVATVTAGPNGTQVGARILQARPTQGQLVDVDMQVQETSSGIGGSLHATDHVDLAGRSGTLALDAGLNRDGWQGVVRGTDNLGATFEGALALSGTNLSGEVRAHELVLPGVASPADLTLRADGPVAALPLTLTVTGGAPVRLGAGSETLAADFRGSLEATLRGARLEGLHGALGPLKVSGRLSLAPRSSTLDLELAPTDLRGPVAGRLALQHATLQLGPDGVRPSGTLTVGTLSAGPLRVRPGPLTLAPAASQGGWLRATTADSGATIDLSVAALHADFQQLPLALAGTPLTVDGTVQLPLARAPLARMAPDLTVAGAGAELTLRGSGAAVATDLQVAAGTAVGALRLARPLQLAGAIDLSARTGTVTGSAGDLPLRAAFVWRPAGPQLTLTAGSGRDPLRGELGQEGWSLQGNVALAPLGAALGVPVSGSLSSDLRADRSRGGWTYLGRAAVHSTLPVASDVVLTGAGTRLTANVRTRLAGQEVTAEGRLLPTLALRAHAGAWGQLALAGGSLSGSGTLPSRSYGPYLTMPGLAWRMRGTIAPLDVVLTAGQGRLRLEGSRLAGALSIPLRYGGLPLKLRVATAGAGATDPASRAPWASVSAGIEALPLSASLLDRDGKALLSATGTPGSISLAGSLPAATLAAPLPAAVRPTGAVEVHGRASLARGARYQLALAWTRGGEAIQASLTGSSSSFRLAASGAGMALQAAPGVLSLSAKHAVVGGFLGNLGTDAQLDGAVGYDHGTWSGALRLRATRPATVAVDVSAHGRGLDLQAEASTGSVAVSASGTILPTPRLQVTGRALGDAVSLRARTSGTWAAPDVTATLASRAVAPAPWLALPARRATLEWTGPGDALRGEGTGFSLGGSWSDVRASLTLPVTFAGARQLLELRLSGPAAALELTGRLTGPLANGALSGNLADGIDAKLALSAAGWRPRLGSAAPLLGGDTTVTAHLAADGSWSAEARTSLAAAKLALPVEARLHGHMATFAGAVHVRAPNEPSTGPPLASAAITGRAGAASASIDLAAVDYAELGNVLGIPLDVSAAGVLRLASSPIRASLAVQASGTAAGTKIALDGRAGGGSGVRLTAAYGRATATLRGTAAQGLKLHVTGPAGLDLQGPTTLGPKASVTLTGQRHGSAISVQAHANLPAGSGGLQAHLGAASLVAAVTRSGTATSLRVHVDAPDGSLAPIGSGLSGTVDATATLAGSALQLDRLTASSALGPTPWRLDLQGAAYPSVDLHGTLVAPRWRASAGLVVTGSRTRLSFLGTLGQLSVAATADGARLQDLTVDGTTQLAALSEPVSVRAQALSWTPTAGFGGSARLAVPAGVAGLPGNIVVELAGNGALRARATGGTPGRVWASASARISSHPVQDRALQGEVRVDAPLARWARLPASATLRLAGTPQLGGSWSQPTLDGELALTGTLKASGRVHFDTQGGTLALAGTGVTLDATYRDGVWHGTTALQQVSLGALDPGLTQVTASLRAEASVGRQGLSGNVSGLRLEAPGVALTGSATLGDGVRVALQAQADLSAMALPGLPLTGLLHGPLVLAAPSLADLTAGNVVAILDVAGLGTAGMAGTADGTLQVGGSLAQPSLSVSLQGNGDLHGRLRVDATPSRSRFAMRSTLAYHGIATDVNAVLRSGRFEASGRMQVGNAIANLSSDGEGDLLLKGAKILDGWQARIGGKLDRARVTGSLATLGVDAGGVVALSFGGRPWLHGTVRGTTVQGVTLGDLALASDALGAPVTLEGPHVRATLHPNTLDWQAALEEQPLVDRLQASGRASGKAGHGSASLMLQGKLAGAPVDLSVHASALPGVVIDVAGSLLGGSFTAHGTAPDGRLWGGTVALHGAHLAGIAASVTGTFAGALTRPSLHAGVALTGPIEGNATLDASSHGVRVDAGLSGSAIGGELDVHGTVAPGLDMTLSAPSSGGPTRGRLRLFEAGSALRAEGRLRLASGPFDLDVRGNGTGGPVGLRVQLPAVPGLEFRGELPVLPPGQLATSVLEHGLNLGGAGTTQGRIQIRTRPTLTAELQHVALDYGGTRFTASGTLGSGDGKLQGSVTLPSSLPVDHVAGVTVPFRVSLTGHRISVASDSRLGSIQAAIDTAAGSGSVHADLHTLPAGAAEPAGSAKLDLAFTPDRGPTGSLAVNGIVVRRQGLPALSIAAAASIADGTVAGNADVSSPRGGVHLSGRWGLGGGLPAALAPNAPSGGSLQARVSNFQLASLPTVARLAPHVSGAVSGILRLRDANVVGRLVAPDFSVAGTPLPLDLQLTGPLGDLTASLDLGASSATAKITPRDAKGLFTFRRFPAQVLAEANVGHIGVSAAVDGLMRFDIPFDDLAASYLRLATENVRLERAGVVTTGNVAFAYNDGTLSIDRAAFQGRGTWQAQGTVGSEKLDLTLSADNADFGPLLGLVPLFARYGVGARGSFSLVARGSPASPKVDLTAQGLDAQVAGTRYRVDHADVALTGSALTASGTIEGLAPLGGSLSAHGSARLTLAPLALQNTDFRFNGSALVPVFGEVTAVRGGITQPPGSAPQLAVSGKLGKPFTIRGSLAPFNVTLRGKGLDLQAPPLLVTSSSVDADVGMRATSKGLALSGELDASEIRMNVAPGASPNGAEATAASGGAQAAAPARGKGAPTVGAGSSGAPVRTPTSTAPASSSFNGSGGLAAPGAHAALQAVIFDHLRINAPQRVLLDASFGSMEAALDLTLTGTAAAPELAGTARALRGSLRFGGRDFTVDQAVATFQPGRGAYPNLDVQAHATFDKRRVLAGTSGISFVQPAQGNSFTVSLSFAGQVQPSTHGSSPVTFDIHPTLVSDAEVQIGRSGSSSTPRPLTDSELLSLITLGRLEVQPQLAGQAGIGTAVAQSAIDTAVNVLIVNELQNALSKALGVDVVEISTTPLSSLLDHSGQPFGVSLRVGGYLTPQLFASYRLGNVSGSGQSYAFSNAVTLSYDLGPLNFDLSGQLSFADAAPPDNAVPQLGVGLRYAFSPNVDLEAGVDLSNVRNQARFGVNFRW